MSQPLPKTVKTLGLVSFLNDASSEMIYPLLPAFVTQSLGAGPAFLGLIEGIAEAVAGLFKIVSGWWSDRLARRKPLVVAGYGLASLARPFIALATAPWHLLLLRFIDRMGKGTRGAPRDALVAEVVAPDQRGRAYGFHRAMDHAGAAVGPLIAAIFLYFRNDLRLLFALASLPALLAFATVVFGLREDVRRHPAAAAIASRPRVPLPGVFWRYLGVLALFTLGNSADAFLILRAQEAGVGLAAVPLLWMFHHVVKASASTHGGAISDRLGRRRAILAGWTVYALTYAGFAQARAPLHVWGLFALYAAFHALTEGPERALVADLAGAEGRGRAFGLFHAVTGAMLLPASLLTGLLWQRFGASVALHAGAALAALAATGLLILVPERGTPSRS